MRWIESPVVAGKKSDAPITRLPTPMIAARLRPFSPTCFVIQRPARSVMESRGAQIREFCSVQPPLGRSGSGQRQRRLCQTSRVP